MNEKASARELNPSLEGGEVRLYRGLSWLVALATPVVIVLIMVRLVMNPLFLQWEYNRPGFPEDRYGFTNEDRMRWAPVAVEYLLNDADISYLADLRFDNGQPLYNARELSHMVDVKMVVQRALTLLTLALLLLVALGVWAWRAGWLEIYRQGLVRGGWLTVFLLLTVLLTVLFTFGVFFTTFHNIFFAEGTWTFLYSDTLIRLFPERFWQDIAILIGGGSLALGLVLALGLRKRA